MKLIDREWVSRAPKLRHVAPFDGIRAIGVFGVMIGHSFPLDTLSYAGIVDIFFVISGFLITSLLLQEHRTHGRIDLRKFYARRSIRLLPLLYVVLFVTAVGALIAKSTGALDGTLFTLKDLAKETLASGFYVHNIVYPTLGGPWHAHLWTLSVEEQFYLIVGLLMLVSLARGGIKVVTAMLVAFVACVQISRGFGITFGQPGLAMAVWLQRPDSLAVGMLGAIACAYLPDPLTPKQRNLMKIGGTIGVLGIFTAVWASTAFARNQLNIHIPFWPGDANYVADPDAVVNALVKQDGWRLHMPGGPFWLQWGFTLSSWSFLLITFPAFRVAEWWGNRILSLKWFVRIGGLLSYGLYVWHYPAQHFTRMIFGTVDTGRYGDHYRMNMSPYLQLLIDVILPFALAVPSYLFVEKKALAIKDRFQVDKAARVEARAAKGQTDPG